MDVASLTAPGGPFELAREHVHGEAMTVFRHRPQSLREFVDQSRRYGSAEYLVHGDLRLSFADHHDAVATVAAALRDRYGIGKGDRVALYAANSAEWVVVFWATVSLGAVVASMNAWWAPPEVEWALSNSTPKVVFADADRVATLRSIGASVAVLTEADARSLIDDRSASELPTTPIDEDDPAVILYTSGTTGRSKGATGSHRGICGFVQMSRHAGAAALTAAGVPLTTPMPRQIALVTVPLFHASGVYGFVVGNLASGGGLVLRSGRFDADEALRLIEVERITIWAALGSMGPRAAERALQTSYDLSSLTVLAIGGAPVSPAHQELLRRAFPLASRAMSMGYTSSEAVAVITRNGGPELAAHPTSAGRVTVTTEVEIRDVNGVVLPEGSEGEIHVRSPYLMLGYWGDQAQTDAVVKPGRWLAMGDIGHFKDGLLYINSRARDMILVNAENVFPTEVEYRLDAHPNVVESAVVGVHDDASGQSVRAYVVTDGSAVDADQLRAWCRDAMAGYKVPTQWVLRSKPLPRNPAGKILKRELIG